MYSIADALLLLAFSQSSLLRGGHGCCSLHFDLQQELLDGHVICVAIKKMATPPPVRSPPPEDEDPSLEEIDSMTGKERFQAIRRRISSSSSMYSPGAGTVVSPADSPPAPPPKRTHVEDENTASLNAKKLTHVTKDRPKRKVRLPSREKLHRESLEELNPPPMPPPMSNAAMDEDDDELTEVPPLPPPPITEEPPEQPSSLPEVPLTLPPPPPATTGMPYLKRCV